MQAGAFIIMLGEPMEPKTPSIAIVTAGVLTVAILLIFEIPERPFALWQAFLIYFTALLPGIGVGLLFDSNAKKAREEYLKINFYEEKH